jgi:hypothetical protein
MRHFLSYWFIAVPRLTKAQAFALFYRFVRYVGHDVSPPSWDDWDEEMKEVPKGDDVV